jgi:hypothetical protein
VKALKLELHILAAPHFNEVLLCVLLDLVTVDRQNAKHIHNVFLANDMYMGHVIVCIVPC